MNNPDNNTAQQIEALTYVQGIANAFYSNADGIAKAIENALRVLEYADLANNNNPASELHEIIIEARNVHGQLIDKLSQSCRAAVAAMDMLRKKEGKL